MKQIGFVLQQKCSNGCGSQTSYSIQDKRPKTRENPYSDRPNVHVDIALQVNFLRH